MTRSPRASAIPATRVRVLYGDRLVPCYAEGPENLDHMLSGVVASHGNRPAIIDGAATVCYRELDRRVSRVASALAACGLTAGDRVAIFVGNRSEFMEALFGIWRLGAIAVPIGIRQSAAELEYMLNQCTASALFYEAALADRLPPGPAIPSVRLFVHIGAREVSADVDSDAEPTAFDELMALGRDTYPPPSINDQAPACIMYTSGTTGHPKGAVLPHLAFFHTAKSYELRFGFRPTDRMLLVIPASHISGLLAVIMVMMQVGGCVVCMKNFKAADVLATIESKRISASTMVPSMYNLCLLEPDIARYDLAHWRIGHFGGAAMPEITIQRLAERVPRLELYNGFGSTETTSAVTLTQAGDAARHPDTVGTMLPCVDIRVLDENGREVPAGEPGELWIRSPGNATGYWNNPKASRESFMAGYWRSGDIGSVDDQGFVRVFDRIKDMINRGGYKVYCVELENVIQRFLGVIEVAAVGSPCPVLGERVHVYLHADADIDAEALKTFCREELADYKTPDFVTVSPTPLPRNLNGKLVKKPLREAAREAALKPATT